MKKVLFILGVLLSLGMFCACSSDDDIADVIESSEGSNDSNIKKLANKELLGVWELNKFDQGWAQIITFKPNEVLIQIDENGTIEVDNKTDVDLSPFVNSGLYSIEVYSKEITIVDRIETQDIISIDGKEFYYYIDDGNILRLYKDYWADGERFDFIKTK